MKSYVELTRHEGNEQLFEIVEMAVISTLWDVPLHIHAEGLRGTGKTTIMRSARTILPPIKRIKGCLYNCHPEHPHCPQHRDLSGDELEQLGTEMVPRPFLEISHSAKIGTVAGSIDLAKITDATKPEAALLPGIIPQAHRGIIFIDEINRLADTAPEITDVLLDVMGTKPGRIQIEETGLPVVEIPVQVSVWAASNPDEEPGPLQEIRRQLSDRFDLVMDMGRSKDPEAIAQILMQSEHSRKNISNDPQKQDNQDNLSRILRQMEETAISYHGLTMPDFLRNYIARTYVKYNLESLRAIEAIQHCALLSCALRGGDKVLISDILKVIPLALQHRMERTSIAKILGGSDGPLSGKRAAGSGPAWGGNQSSGTGGQQSGFGTSASSGQGTAPSKSIFDPLKQLLSGKPQPPHQPVDDITAAPQGEARRIKEIKDDDLIKTEGELGS